MNCNTALASSSSSSKSDWWSADTLVRQVSLMSFYLNLFKHWSNVEHFLQVNDCESLLSYTASPPLGVFFVLNFSANDLQSSGL